MPPSIAAKPEAKAEFEALMQKLQDAYNKFTEMGIPAEDARYVLPNAAGNQKSSALLMPVRC